MNSAFLAGRGVFLWAFAPVPGYEAHTTVNDFSRGFWDLSSGSPACPAGTLPTEPSQPLHSPFCHDSLLSPTPVARECLPNRNLGQGGSIRLGLSLIFSTTLLLFRHYLQRLPLSSLGRSSLSCLINYRDAVSRETESQLCHALWIVLAFCPHFL